MPDNFADLYLLPPAVTSAIKNQVMRGFPVHLDGPGQVALFTYDNNTFVIESFRSEPATMTVSLAGNVGDVKDLVTGESIAVDKVKDSASPPSVQFSIRLQPHSYRVFREEKETMKSLADKKSADN